MSNIEKKFESWQERMSKKSEQEKHNYALTVAIFVGCVALFFVISTWYFRIFGDNIQTSYFTEIEEIYRDQKANILNIYNKF